ncbi:MAG: hypothetical protein ABFS34_15235 [Gemmatimonadota bacterium]
MSTLPNAATRHVFARLRRATPLILLLAACAGDSGDRPEESIDDEAAADTSVQPAPAPPEESGSATLPADRVRADPPPPEIYYSLDEFDWYRQALPIVHEGAAYQGLDTVVVLSTLELDSLGRFGGVMYWSRPLEAPDTLYVPVFEGYWLPFARMGADP